MKKIFLLFLVLPLFGVELINYNIYDRNDRVDLMLSFDGAYSGDISQKTEKNFTLLTLNELKYSKEELKSLNSSLVDKVQISSKGNKTYIMLQNKTKIHLNISSINDKFGIRIRITEARLNEANISPPANTATSSSTEFLPQGIQSSSSSEKYDYTQYILVMFVLIVLLLGLWWFKRTMNSKIFLNSKNFTVAFQRPLDKNNQFMILDYKNKRYVVIVGASNLLLESLEIPEEEMQKKEEDFNSVFEENKRKIQKIIQKRQKT